MATVRLTASDLYSYMRPAPCELRVHLLYGREAQVAPSVFEELLLRLGIRHEREYLDSLGEVLNLTGFSEGGRLDTTRQAVGDGVPVIYQGALEAEAELLGVACTIYGEPDFLVRFGDGYVIRDAKLSRRINESEHPEIIQSLRLYAWLYEQSFGLPPAALEVFAGNLKLVEIEVGQGDQFLQSLSSVLGGKVAAEEPFSPVGWSKCQGCGFRTRCWDPAVERNDVAILPDVDVGLARALRDRGISVISELSDRFSIESLAEFRRPRGRQLVKVGKKAERILLHAEAWERDEPLVLGPLAIPQHDSYVVFDLEGLPPFADDLDRIYLWGFKVFGAKTGVPHAVAACPGEDGDRETWYEFLDAAALVMNEHSDIPWVHWSAYERTYVRKYVERFGDRAGVAARLQEHLVDLLPLAKDALILPIPSYSLKAVEEYVGFKRSQDAFGGDWSIARYIEAVESEDLEERTQLLDEICTYNREDLEATWAVLQWMLVKTAA